MDGPHDLGGRPGFGAVHRESDEPTFHGAWEGRSWALNLLAIGKLRAYNADAYRHAVERIPEREYYAFPYYGRMLVGATTLLVENGVITDAELEERLGGPPAKAAPVDRTVGPLLGSCGPDPTVEHSGPAFSTGERVVVVAPSFPGHIRCPAYLRGHAGSIIRVYPEANNPELRAHKNVRAREHTYAVEFAASDLWEDADPGTTVVVELFESYLAPAAGSARAAPQQTASQPTAPRQTASEEST